MTTPRVSIVMASYNRRAVVLETLDALAENGLPADEYEVIVVDNASTDGTPAALARRPDVRSLPLRVNRGSCAKALGVGIARGEFIVFLDDDSCPRPGSLERMLAHFAALPTLGAAGFLAHLPDGSQECSALPHVFIGCGVGFRARALREVGGLDPSFFMQAEEYDLSFRLLACGWDVRTFGDLAVEHRKSPQARRSDRTMFLDTRNNLRVVARYLPREYARIYRDEWRLRYAWLAERLGQSAAYRRGVRAGWWRGLLERLRYARWRLSQPVLERVFAWERLRREFADLVEAGVERVVLADLGKNVYAFWRAARAVGVDVAAIASDAFAAPGRTYRGVPVLTTDAALKLDPDAYVVSNTSFVHATQCYADLRTRTSRPVHHWFGPPPGGPATRAINGPVLVAAS